MAALVDLLDAACRRAPDRLAIAGESESLTYGALAARAATLASALATQGIEPNEPVLVLVSNQPGDLAAFFGVWRARGVAVPVHRSTPAAALAGYVEATGARLLVDAGAAPALQTGFAPALGAGFAPCTAVQAACEPTSNPAAPPMSRPAPAARPTLDDAALIVFTSGSTGKPKGAVLSHRAIAGKLAANDSYLHFSADERTLLVLNITFSFGVWVSLLTLVKAGTLVMRERFRSETFLAELISESIDRVAVVPTMMRALLPKLDIAEQRARLAGLTAEGPLRQIMIGGEFLPAALGARIERSFPRAALIDIYGLTETATSDFILLPAERAQHGGCIGRPAPQVEFRIGGAQRAGEVGELQIRTPFIMNGYLDAPELTAAAFDDGYFRTGDLARVRADGVVELVGRAKEIVNRAGAKISPLEIEQVFAQCAGVAGVLATGVPDATLGERLHVLLVPVTDAVLDAAALRTHAATHLEKFKQPDRYYCAADLPLGRTGKADRGALRALIEAGSLRPLQ